MAIKPPILVIGALVMASLACIVSDVRDVAKTVSSGVALLQEIEQSGTWKYIGDGLTALDTANGYAATFQLAEGSTNATGDTLTSTTQRVTWTTSTDSDGDSRVSVVENDQREEYVIINRGQNRTETYRVNDGKYDCVIGTEDAFLAATVTGTFAQYSALAVGIQAISVAEEEGSASVGSFSTTKYRLVSKLPEALEILSNLPAADLQAQIAEVPEFYIDGALYIDDASKALVRFEAAYADLEKNQGNQFSFEVTELGNQADIQINDSDITTACPTPSTTSGQ